jgi:hypothetical protein
MTENVVPLPVAADAATPATAHEPLYVHLAISDPEVILAALEYPEGRPRTDFIQTALKIGVLSLRAARGVVDGDAIRREGDLLLSSLSERLNTWRELMEQGVTSTLTHYFDPTKGTFTDRVERLVRSDGELAKVMGGQVQIAEQSLTKVFEQFIGENSQLLKVLDPSGDNQLVATMQRTLDGVVQAQNLAISTQFSLDEPNSALTRFMRELTSKHGDLNQALSLRLNEVVAEFSLDREDSALSRLVGRVETAHKSLTNELSLDHPDSTISRLQTLMNSHHAKLMETANKLSESLSVAIGALQARKEEAAKSTRHGLEFEAAVGESVKALLGEAGDVVQDCGATTGVISHCKVGDFLITLAQENVAAGAKIVVEAKESAAYDLAKTLAEADTARRNRGAGICVFVHSTKTAPDGVPDFQRFGHDIVVKWDAESETSDLSLKAALMVAKAMSVKAAQHSQGEAASYQIVDRAIESLRKQIAGFDEISTSATTSAKSAATILRRVDLMKAEIEEKVGVLSEQIVKLKSSAADDA